MSQAQAWLLKACFAAGTPLLLADEPTAALDEETGAAVMNLLQELCQQRGATLLVASHDPALNQRFEQTLDLRNGKLFPSHTAKVNA